MAIKILIQTALSLEFAAVKKYLPDGKPLAHPTTSSIYNKGIYQSKNSSCDVLLVETGAGNVRAADETSRALEFFKPDYAFFVGVAGGIKDVKLGDVVASTKIIGYEMGKIEETFKPRFDSAQASYELEQIAKHVKRENLWLEKNQDITGQMPSVFVQPIAAGEKVVASNRSSVFSYLKQFCSEAVAVDMEGNGFLIAARAYHAHAIEIRGVSDLIVNKEEADASGSQPTAAQHAAAFTFAMIDYLLGSHFAKKDLNSSEFQKMLVEELVKLYPQGPEENQIWQRAGGDVSILVNTTSRKSQWRSAIEKLALGGGGRQITLSSLLDEIKEDFPNYTSEILGI